MLLVWKQVGAKQKNSTAFAPTSRSRNKPGKTFADTLYLRLETYFTPMRFYIIQQSAWIVAKLDIDAACSTAPRSCKMFCGVGLWADNGQKFRLRKGSWTPRTCKFWAKTTKAKQRNGILKNDKPARLSLKRYLLFGLFHLPKQIAGIPLAEIRAFDHAHRKRSLGPASTSPYRKNRSVCKTFPLNQAIGPKCNFVLRNTWKIGAILA